VPFGAVWIVPSPSLLEGLGGTLVVAGATAFLAGERGVESGEQQESTSIQFSWLLVRRTLV
jgi:hypothetical protein